jgi:hypothetical protein
MKNTISTTNLQRIGHMGRRTKKEQLMLQPEPHHPLEMTCSGTLFDIQYWTLLFSSGCTWDGKRKNEE